MDAMTSRPHRTRRIASTLALVLAVAVVGCAQGPAAPPAPPGATPPASATPAPTGTPAESVEPTPSATSTASAGPSASAGPATPAGPTASTTPSTNPSATATALACGPSTGEPLKRAPGSGKTVALTFDDGPGPQTLAVADALAAAGVHATFFVTGEHAQARPEVVKELVRRGHLVAGHSWDHRYPKSVKGGWTASFVGDQITRTADLLATTTGHPACFFRPPGGFMDGVTSAAKRERVAVVMWSVDSLDWKQPGSTTASATRAIVTQATAVGDQQHPIVLFHDFKASGEPDSKVSPNRSNTIAALPDVIAFYQAKGYRFVRLDGRP